jgi:hypothetical protein
MRAAGRFQFLQLWLRVRRFALRALVQLHFPFVKRPQQRKQPRIERPLGAVARLGLAQSNTPPIGLQLDLRVLLQERAGEDADLGAQSAATGLGLSDGNLCEANRSTSTASAKTRIAPVTIRRSVPVRCSAPTISIRTRARAVMAMYGRAAPYTNPQIG